MNRLKELIILVFCFVILFIISICLYTGINRSLYTPIGLILLIFFFYFIYTFFSKKTIEIFDKKSFKIIGIVLIFAFSIVLGISMRVGLTWDYGVVLKSAFDFSKNGVQELVYFAMYTNNLAVVSLLTILSKILLVFNPSASLKTFQIFTIVFNSILVTVSFYLIAKLSSKNFNKQNTFLIVLTMLMYVNFFVFVPVLYSDTTSLILIMLALLFLYLNENSKTKNKKTIYFILMILTLGLGFRFKATTIFLYLSIFVLWFLNKDFKKLLISVPIMLISIFMFKFIINSIYPIPNDVYEKYNFPYIHWISMSIEPNGVGGFSESDVNHLLEFEGIENKKIESKRILVERINNFGPKGLIKKIFKDKMFAVWTNPSIGSTWILSQEPQNHTIFHEFFAYGGKYIEKYELVFRSVWLFIIIGTFISGLINLKEKNDNILIYQMCIIFEFLFLCIWEVHSRYIYSFLPFFFFTSAYGYKNAFDVINGKSKIKDSKMLKKCLEIYKKHEEIINYLIIGGLTTLISLIVKYGLLFTILDSKNAIQLQISVIASWIISVLFAYVTNRKFVFKSKDKNIIQEASKFFGSRVATLLLDAAIMWFFVTLLKLNSNIQVIIVTLVSQVLVIVGNYILSKLFVFKKKK